MTAQANSRIWRGAVLSVRDDVDGSDTAWIDFANCIDYSFPGVASAKLDASTAASMVDQFRLGLRDRGQATFNVFDYMDSDFLAAMDAMQDAGETRKFKLVLPEGAKTTRIFEGYVVDQPITGAYNTLWKMTLTLKVVSDFWFLYPAPTGASISNSAAGSAAGGDTRTITGNNFEVGLTSILIGGNTVAAEDVTVNSRTSLTFVTPAHAAATVTVSVSTPSGTSSNIAGGFTYS